MYTGTMIEDLIQAVAHAEEQARRQEPVPLTVWMAPAPQPQPQAAILHARADSYIGQMVGVA